VLSHRPAAARWVRPRGPAGPEGDHCSRWPSGAAICGMVAALTPAGDWGLRMQSAPSRGRLPAFDSCRCRLGNSVATVAIDGSKRRPVARPRILARRIPFAWANKLMAYRPTAMIR